MKDKNHSSDLEDCIEDLRIISLNPMDKKLLKQELLDKYSDYTIKLAKKINKENQNVNFKRNNTVTH